MKILEEFEKALDKYLSLRSFPVGVKLLERGQGIPANMGRPKRDLGEPVRPCVGWHVARHLGFPVTMLEDDFATACPTGIFVFGLLEPITSWINGALAHESYTGSMEAAITMEKHVFRLKVGKYQGVSFAPLRKLSFDPDVIMVFCNSKDAGRLVSAAAWINGEPVKASIAARDLCADAIIQPFQTGCPVIALPCAGDREYGRTQDDEIVFATPADRLEGIIAGLEGYERSHKAKNLGEESEIRKKYNEMSKALDKILGKK